MSLWEVRKPLVFRSKKMSVEDANSLLVIQIKRRLVAFKLSEEDETALRKAGARPPLIEAVKDYYCCEERDKYLDKAELLYSAFVRDYNGKTVEEMKRAIKVGREFIELCRNDQSVAEQLKFVQNQIARLERQLPAHEQLDCFRPTCRSKIPTF